MRPACGEAPRDEAGQRSIGPGEGSSAATVTAVEQVREVVGVKTLPEETWQQHQQHGEADGEPPRGLGCDGIVAGSFVAESVPLSGGVPLDRFGESTAHGHLVHRGHSTGGTPILFRTDGYKVSYTAHLLVEEGHEATEAVTRTVTRRVTRRTSS